MAHLPYAVKAEDEGCVVQAGTHSMYRLNEALCSAFLRLYCTFCTLVCRSLYSTYAVQNTQQEHIQFLNMINKQIQL